MTIKLPWQRFWAPPSTALLHKGYLVDPRSRAGSVFSANAKTVEDRYDAPCLVLVGEPGMGKTTAMQASRASLDERSLSAGESSLWVNLRDCADAASLRHDLFEDPRLLEWKRGSHVLNLYLDSLDECALQVKIVAALLEKGLEQLPTDRLRLRTSCRIVEWPRLLDGCFERLFTTVERLELLPLTKEDVELAARSHPVDVSRFFAEVKRLDAGAFASKPQTLFFLLKIFARTGELPKTHVELFEKGCLELCTEKNLSREAASRGMRTLDPEEKLLVADRIAALMIFSGRTTVHSGFAEDLRAEDLSISEICGGVEIADGRRVEVSREHVLDALGTSLFSSVAPTRYGWAHKTYQEFLAARHLVRKSFSNEQIASLIFHPELTGKVVPQLREVASWIANLHAPIFELILANEPMVLLQSDIEAATPATRRKIVEDVLSDYDVAKTGFAWEYWSYFRRLDHPDLVDQLRTWIEDKRKPVGSRIMAAQIAESCKLRQLGPALTCVALDTSESYDFRVMATRAVRKIGGVNARLRLVPLTVVNRALPTDDLQAAAIDATWPDCIDAATLFSHLTAPNKPNHFGSLYDVSHRVVDTLPVADLPTALKWVRVQPSRFDRSYFSSAIEELLHRGWLNVHKPDVRAALAATVLVFARRYENPFGRHKELVEDAERRHALVREIIIATFAAEARTQADRESAPFDATFLTWQEHALVRPTDIEWLVDEHKASRPEHRGPWLELITRVMWMCWGHVPLDPILEAFADQPDLEDALAGNFRDVALESNEAIERRSHFEEVMRPRTQQQRYDRDPVVERVERHLAAFESGENAAYWRSHFEMTTGDHHGEHVHEDEFDLLKYPGWNALGPEARARFLSASKQYLLRLEGTKTWLGGEGFDRPSAAAYRALLLVLQRDPAWVNELPSGTWRAVAPAIVSLTNEESDELIALSLANAPQESLCALGSIIDAAPDTGNASFLIRKMAGHWSPAMERLFLKKLSDPHVSPHVIRDLGNHLLAHKSEPGLARAVQLVAGSDDSSPRAVAAAAAAANAIAHYAVAPGWSAVWSMVMKSDVFGARVIEQLSLELFWDRAGRFGAQLTEAQLQELYLWLSEKYPKSSDTPRDTTVVDLRASTAEFRDGVLGALVAKSTQAACSAIRRLSLLLPNVSFEASLRNATLGMLRATWVTSTPADILALGRAAEARVVHSARHLREVLVESLGRLQQKLHGELVPAKFLWNVTKGPPPSSHPRSEEDFSDYIELHLREDLTKRGIISNREVQLTRPIDESTGERTDIYVDAVLHDPDVGFGARVSVIIEVKGCWNKGLKTSMMSQLRDRYLSHGDCTQGIYLVGWFRSSTYKQGPKWTLGKYRAHFETQAAMLSNDEIDLRAVVLDVSIAPAARA